MTELKTFIFTDIVRSVALKAEMSGRNDIERDQGFIESVLTPHRDRIGVDLSEHAGRIVSTAGDGHFLVFSDTVQAAAWAVGVQRRHQDDPIKTPHGSTVEVRISIHVGRPQIDPRDENNFVGKTVDYTARLNDFAQGGQVLISRSVASMLDDAHIEGMTIHPHGQRMLRGIGNVEVHELVYRDAGPMETVYLPANLDEREFTVIHPGGASPTGASPAASTRPTSGSGQTARPSSASGRGSAMESATELHQRQPRRLGNYELAELLGSGGMGDVYRARHVQFDRERAIKIIKQHFVDAGHEDVVRRFYQEIKATGALEHPNIVVAVESSTPEDHEHFLVMEFIEGIALSDLISQRGPLGVPDACEIARQAARGLAYLHRHGMVHRDIKPSNMMLTLSEQGAVAIDDASSTGATFKLCGVIKILDLGLALLATDEQERLTRFDQRAMGTGMYMSPEQWKTTSVDIRADIYSLGCTLYHLLAGRPPFYDSDLKPEKAHEKSRIPQIFGPTSVPKKLWDVIKRMLAKRPEDRIQTPGEVAAALAPFCEGSDLVSLMQESQTVVDEETSLTGTAPRSRPDVDTLPLASSTKTGRRQRWWERRGVRWGAVACIFLAIVATGASIWLRRNLPVVLTDQHAEAAEWIATLPGLSGVPWFEEAPWLFPEERVRLLYAMRERQFEGLETLSREADAEEFYGRLRAAVASRDEERSDTIEIPPSLVGEDYSYCRDVLKSLDPLAHNARDEIQSLIDVLAERPEGARPAAEWHLIGILHAESQDRNLAIEALDRAAAKYEESMGVGEGSPPIIRGLLALCRSDRAAVELVAGEGSRIKDQLYAGALQVLATDATPCFCVYVHGARSLTRLNDSSQTNEQIAEPLLKAIRQLDDDRRPMAEDHPLRAYVHERRAHFLLETWQLTAANHEARTAAAMRDRFAKITELDKDPAASEKPVKGYHFAQQAYFRARQLQALADHYLGVTSGETASAPLVTARERLNRLLGYLQNQGRSTLSPAQKAIWWSLRPNFLGRRADCEIFLMGDFSRAEKTMRDAIDEALSLEWDNNPAKQRNLAFMQLKRTIALALASGSKGLQSKQPPAPSVTPERSSASPGQRRFEVFEQVSSALAQPEPKRSEMLFSALQSGVAGLDSRSRDRRQLLLFVCIYLEKKNPPEGTNPSWDAQKLPELKRILVGPAAGDDRGEPYLNRPYIKLVRDSVYKLLDDK